MRGYSEDGSIPLSSIALNYEDALRRQREYVTVAAQNNGSAAMVFTENIMQQAGNNDAPSTWTCEGNGAATNNVSIAIVRKHLGYLSDSQAKDNLRRLLAYDSIVALIEMCWAQNPKDRPNAAFVVEALTEIRKYHEKITDADADSQKAESRLALAHAVFEISKRS